VTVFSFASNLHNIGLSLFAGDYPTLLEIGLIWALFGLIPANFENATTPKTENHIKKLSGPCSNIVQGPEGLWINVAEFNVNAVRSENISFLSILDPTI
jgi:Zn-dependent protease